MDKRFYGLRLRDIKHMAFQLAISNNLKHPFNVSKKSAGKKWLRAFLHRHPELSIRTPQATSAARIKGFNPEAINSFLDIYESEMEKIKYSPYRIYNVDETGITVVQHKQSKIISVKGKKQEAGRGPDVIRKRKTNNCRDMYERLWELRSTNDNFST